MPSMLSATVEEVNSWADIVEKVLGIYFNGGKKFKNPLVWSWRTHKDKTMMTYIEHRGNGKARGPCRLPIGYNYEGMLIAIYELIFEFVDGPFDTQTFAEFKERCEQTLKKYKCKSALRHPNNEKKRNKSEAKSAFGEFLEFKHNQLNEEEREIAFTKIQEIIKNEYENFSKSKESYSHIVNDPKYVFSDKFKEFFDSCITDLPDIKKMSTKGITANEFKFLLTWLYDTVETIKLGTVSYCNKQLAADLEKKLGLYANVCFNMRYYSTCLFELYSSSFRLKRVVKPVFDILNYEGEHLVDMSKMVNKEKGAQIISDFEKTLQSMENTLNEWVSKNVEEDIERKRKTLIKCLQTRIDNEKSKEEDYYVSYDHLEHMKKILEDKKGALESEEIELFDKNYSGTRNWHLSKYDTKFDKGFFKNLDSKTTSTIIALMAIMVDVGSCGGHDKI